MSDIVTSQILSDGRKDFIIVLTGLSDGTGEALVAKTNCASMSGPPNTLRLMEIQYDIDGVDTPAPFSVSLFWEGTPNQPMLQLRGHGKLDFKEFGGLLNNATLPEGDVLLSTNNPVAGATYTLILKFFKEYNAAHPEN
jgi:hypothetical protein